MEDDHGESHIQHADMNGSAKNKVGYRSVNLDLSGNSPTAVDNTNGIIEGDFYDKKNQAPTNLGSTMDELKQTPAEQIVNGVLSKPLESLGKVDPSGESPPPHSTLELEKPSLPGSRIPDSIGKMLFGAIPFEESHIFKYFTTKGGPEMFEICQKLLPPLEINENGYKNLTARIQHYLYPRFSVSKSESNGAKFDLENAAAREEREARLSPSNRFSGGNHKSHGDVQDNEDQSPLLTQSRSSPRNKFSGGNHKSHGDLQDYEDRCPHPTKYRSYSPDKFPGGNHKSHGDLQDNEDQSPLPTQSRSSPPNRFSGGNHKSHGDLQDNEDRCPHPTKYRSYSPDRFSGANHKSHDDLQDNEDRCPHPTEYRSYSPDKFPGENHKSHADLQENEDQSSLPKRHRSSIPNKYPGENYGFSESDSPRGWFSSNNQLSRPRDEFYSSKSHNYAGFTQVPWPTAGTKKRQFRDPPQSPPGNLNSKFQVEGEKTIPQQFRQLEPQAWGDRVAVLSQLFNTARGSYLKQRPLVIADDDLDNPLHLHFAGRKRGFYYQAACMSERLQFQTIFQALTYMAVTFMSANERDLNSILKMGEGTMEEYSLLVNFWNEVILCHYAERQNHHQCKRAHNLLCSGMLMQELGVLINHKVRVNDATRNELKRTRNRDTFIVYETTTLPNITCSRPTLLDQFLFAGYRLEDQMVRKRDFRYFNLHTQSQEECMNWAGICFMDIRDRMFHEDYYSLDLNSKVPEYPLRCRENMPKRTHRSYLSPFSAASLVPTPRGYSRNNCHRPCPPSSFYMLPFQSREFQRAHIDNHTAGPILYPHPKVSTPMENYQPVPPSQGHGIGNSGTLYEQNTPVFQSNWKNPTPLENNQLLPLPVDQGYHYSRNRNFDQIIPSTHPRSCRNVEQPEYYQPPKDQGTYYPRPQKFNSNFPF